MRPVDVYISQQLTPPTLAAMQAYKANQNATTAALMAKYLLNDFNTIVLGPNIYDPLRFAGITITVDPTGSDTIAINQGPPGGCLPDLLHAGPVVAPDCASAVPVSWHWSRPGPCGRYSRRL